MPMLELREYQSDLTVRAFKALARSGSVVIQLETGAGKTHIAAEMCRVWVRAKKRVWFVAHRREILDQARAIFDEGAIKHGPGARVQFKMIAAAMKGGEPGPDVVIFDECHHAAAESWRKVAEAHPKALRLGLTATPNRLDGAALSECFAEIEHGPAARDLRANSHLARYQYFAPVLPDLSAVKVRDKEYDRGSIAQIMTGASIVGDVVEHYRKHADGKRAILFAVSVAASQDMAARFNAAGIAARHVDAETSDEDRASAIRAFRAGRVRVLCNVELFTEGFDLPSIGAVILLRPTRSLALYRQMIGRGSRFMSPKARTVILDHAALVAEHGLPDEEYVWTLDGKPPRRKVEIEGGARARMRRCPKCSAVHEWALVCEECGHEYAVGPRDVTEVGGHLEEVKIPYGCVNKHTFAKMMGYSSHKTVSKKIALGMPTINGFIPVETAKKWQQRRISEGKINRARALKEKWENDPVLRKEVLDRFAAARPKLYADPSHLDKMRKSAQRNLRALWSDPNFKGRTARKGHTVDPKIIEDRRKQKAKVRESQIVRLVQSEKMKKLWADPEIRKRMLAGRNVSK